MQYKSYQHICRLNTDETEGILNGTVYVTTKIDGCFSSKQTVLMADGSSKPISKIEVGDFVYSYNLRTNTTEVKPVTNVYCHVCEPTAAQAHQWLKIRFNRRYDSLYSKIATSKAYMCVTKNHNIFVKRNGHVIDVPANELVVGDIVLNITKGVNNYIKQCMYSGFLGDGSPSPSRLDAKVPHSISFGYGEKQREHAKFKAYLLGGTYHERSHVDGYVADSTRCIAVGRHSPAIDAVYNEIFKDAKKIISRTWLDKLDNLGLALWYMDDGSLTKRVGDDTCLLHTEGYSYEENLILQEFLKLRGYDFHIYKSQKSDGKVFYFLSLMQHSSDKFFEDICEYIIPSMQYKLPKKFRGRYKNIEISQEILPTVIENEVVSIEQCHEDDFYKGNFGSVNKTFKKYDLEVADNHNYFVGGILVHNSNACVFRKDDGSVGVGNRNRELTPIMDNHGCASYVLSEPKFKMFLDKHPDCMLFGEWLIKNHTKNYQRDAWHKVYVFDVMQQVGGTLRYVPYEEYVPWLEEFGIEYIPVVAKIDNPTEEDLKAIMDIAHFLQDEPGTQEGLVLRNYQYRNKYGRQTWAKIVREEYNQRKYEKQPKGEHELEQIIVDRFCTDAFIEKEYSKLAVDGWNSKLIPRLLGTVWHEFIVEESWNFIKKYKNPVIDFRVLNQLIIARVKEVKKELF